MRLPRLFVPTVLILNLLGLGAWAYAVFMPVTDLRVTNSSGAALTGLRVCFQIGGCAERPELAPGQTWRVPLRIDDDNGAALTYDGMGNDRLANVYVTPGMGVRWLVRPGGQLEARQ